MSRLWKTTLPARQAIAPEEVLDNEQLVEYFLKIHEYWWTDLENSLYGKHLLAKSVLLYWLKTDEEPPRINYNMIYVLNKFREFLSFWKVV
jgi:hypothetical protein